MSIMEMIIGFVIALVFMFHGLMFFIIKRGRKYGGYSKAYMVWSIIKIAIGITYIVWFFIEIVARYG